MHTACPYGKEKQMGTIADVTALIISREGKNSYTQSYLREQVFNGYSDCSSLVWKCYQKGMGIFIGTWTGEQINKGSLVFANSDEAKKGLVQSDLGKMQEGDLIFWGPSRGDSRHVEYYVGNNQISGHGFGIGPVRKTATEYRHSYQLLEVRRYTSENTPVVKNYLAKGDTGAKVAAMQEKLIALGYSCGNYGADGDYGSYTVAAVKAFQKDYKLTADGIYGPLTQKKLEEAYDKAGKNEKVDVPSKRKVLFTGMCIADDVNVRLWAGTEYAAIQSHPRLNSKELVEVLAYTQKDVMGEDWYYVRIDGKYFGFVKAEYIKQI